MLEKRHANESGKSSHEIRISGMFNISVQKADRKSSSENPEDIELYTGIENMGIYDSDEGRAAMDRNYGIRIPEKIRNYFKNNDWGLADFKKLMEAAKQGRITEQDIRVVGFDFDGLRTRKDAAFQQNRVEDVFKEEIEAKIRAVLGKALQ